MTECTWNGARWWKFDIHAHTPASKDYGKGKNQTSFQELSPKEWLLHYMRAGIDCVAVTDHNTGEWIDPVKKALDELESEKPDGFRPLCVFPGVEISVHGGVHLLAILGCDKTTSDIDNLLGAVGFPSTKKGSSDAVTTKTFTDVVEAIVLANGIAIPAHVDDDNGLFQLPGTTLQQVLDCKDIFAMELRNPAHQKPQLYINEKLHWTEILGSDAHHPSGGSERSYPGSHFTWTKMGSPSIEGLQLALLDGALSVGRSDQNTGDLNEYAPLTLEAIEVSQARYMGRSQSFTIGFNPWFNAIIGGRGTGKSTVVEFLRIALRRKDELPKTLLPEFEQYSRVYQDREDSGLLTNKASIRVLCQKDGDQFRIQWNPPGDLEPIEQKMDGQWQRAEGDIRQRFPVRIYSQKQIFQLAKTPLALLKIIDEAPEVDYPAWSEKWKVEESRFLSIRAKAREIKASFGEESRLRGELADVRRRLDIFEQSGHAEILKSFQKRSRQYREIEIWEKSWAGIGDLLRKVAAEIVPDLPEDSLFDWDSLPDKELQKLTAKMRDRLDEIRKSVKDLSSQTNDIVTEWRKSKEESSWKQSVDAAMQAYQKLQDDLAREGINDPAAYGELVQRQQIIEQRLKELDERKKQVNDLNNEADACLQNLLKIRQELTESRQKFLKHVLMNNEYVRIQVAPYGAQEMVESGLRQILQRQDGTFDKDIGSPNGEGLLGELYRNSGGVQDTEQNLLNIKTQVRKIASGEYAPGTVADRRFATHVSNLPPESIDRLDLWFPEDSLEVQYSARGDGQRFRSIQEGSPGQKTAALLAFLLSYGNEPLILDQPEDDLDNHLIYDLIVTQLRAIKRHRQVIVVTHNANIVVNGDAEQVLALAARSGETHKECEGSLQEQQVRGTICTVMEGGRRAFDDRYRRIALEGRHV